MYVVSHTIYYLQDHVLAISHQRAEPSNKVIDSALDRIFRLSVNFLIQNLLPESVIRQADG